MSNKYQTIIIGAGIAGATIAHALSQQGQKVLVIEKDSIASGGSGSAGAFVSPKIGKGSPLQTLTNIAFEFAQEFYQKVCPNHFHSTGVIRIPKDAEDAKQFSIYEKANQNSYEIFDSTKLKSIGIESPYDAMFFPDAGDCDAIEVCKSLLEGIDIAIADVTEIKKIDNQWSIGKYLSSNLILTTGYENNLIDMRYMRIEGIWGSRGDFSSNIDLPISMHQSISIGANQDNIIKIGATHQREIQKPSPCQEEQALLLKQKASSLINTTDLKLQKVYCGMRSSAKDYFPLVGKIIDTEYMLKNHPNIKKGTKAKLKYIDNLFVLNGLGGRGFVFAPLIADILTQHIIHNKEIDPKVNADRTFWKWCRRLG